VVVGLACSDDKAGSDLTLPQDSSFVPVSDVTDSSTSPEDGAVVASDVVGDVGVLDAGPAVDATGCGSHEICKAADGAKPYCDPAKQLCVQCLLDGHCFATTKNCQDGACVKVQCKPGSKRCKDGFIETCITSGDAWDTQVCPDNLPACVVDACKKCHPGELFCDKPVPGGHSIAVLKCNSDGSDAKEASKCTGDQICTQGKCTICSPGAKVCVGNLAKTCANDGASWASELDCGAKGKSCLGGLCIDQCSSDFKTNTHVGCDYWAVDLDNAKEGDKDAQNMQFAVVITNTSGSEAEVTVRSLATTPATEKKFKVAGGALLTIKLPQELGLLTKDSNQEGSNINTRVYNIFATQPIIAYQFNPLDNVGVFSNDASLLLPRTALGKQYYIMAAQQITNYLRSYLTVVAVEAGQTKVTVKPTWKTLSGKDVPSIAKGASKVFTLEHGEVLNIESDAFDADLTGSMVVADKRVAVFGGTEASRSPDSGNCIKWQKDNKTVCAGSSKGLVEYCTTNKECQWSCCADHLEEQMFPVKSWGKTYVGAHLKRRGGEKDTWRVLASEDNTTVTIKPAIGITVPTLSKGQWHQFQTDKDFVLEASSPVLVGQYMAGSYVSAIWEHPTCSTDADCKAKYGFDGRCQMVNAKKVCQPIGDPALLLNMATSQYLDATIFLVPDKYKDNYITIVGPTGAKVTLDGNPVAASQFAPIPGATYSVARLAISKGSHKVQADKPVGVWVYGYDYAVSYGYAAGAKL